MNVEALSRYMADAAARPFRLGHHDCVSFVFEAIREGWDRDFLSYLKYEGRRGAVDRLRASDGLYEAISEHLGPDVPIGDLEIGDIAWLPPSNIGLIMDGYIAVKWRKTVLRIPISEGKTGWKAELWHRR
jgi:hypothetical protein